MSKPQYPGTRGLGTRAGNFNMYVVHVQSALLSSEVLRFKFKFKDKLSEADAFKG